MITYPWQTLAKTQSTSLALIDEAGNFLDWQTFNQRIQQTTFALYQQGVREGAGVAYVGKNSLSILLIYLASIQLGARILALNPAFPIQKCQNLLHQNQIEAIFDEENYLPLCQKIKKLSISVAGDFYPIDTPPLSHTRPATMTLTSGSTGSPKAVVHSIKAHLDNAYSLCELMALHNESRYLLSLPLYHVSGQGIIWRWLVSGSVLMFAGQNFYHSLSQCTHASLVPTQAMRFLDYLKVNSTLPKTKHILLGGADIPFFLTKQLSEQGIQAYCGYGMTEMASTIFAKKANHTAGVGYVLPGRKYRLHNGEIYLKGAGVGLGYWQNGKIKPFTDKDGFFATKDMGYFDNDELFLTGRQDNQFISGGENIHPEEIEKILREHIYVQQAFVFPQNDDHFGARPIALISCEPEKFDTLINDLKFYLEKRLERFKHPIAYYFFNAQDFFYGNIKPSRQAIKQYFNQLMKER